MHSLTSPELNLDTLTLSKHHTVTAPFLKAINYKQKGKLPPPYTQIPFTQILEKYEELQDTHAFGKTKKKIKKSRTKHKKRKSRKKKKKRKKGKY